MQGCCLIEEGFLPPLGSQVFEGAWLLGPGCWVGPWLVSVLLIRLTAILVYGHYITLHYKMAPSQTGGGAREGQFEVRGLWPMCYGIFKM